MRQSRRTQNIKNLGLPIFMMSTPIVLGWYYLKIENTSSAEVDEDGEEGREVSHSRGDEAGNNGKFHAKHFE